MKISENTEPTIYTMNGKTTLHGQEISYTAISEETLLNGNESSPAAGMFSFTYLRSDTPDVSSRPVLFIFNGGPGSSSHLLHLGFFGPDRVKMTGDGSLPTIPPFETEPNPHCMLDEFDLVLIDPVGAGYGRLIDEKAAEEFYGVEADAESFVLFIEKWLTRYDRWNSPRFICGESYGTMRCAVLADALTGGVFWKRFSCISLNGIIMMGTTLHIEGVHEELPVEPSVLKLMSYAAANLYHHPQVGKNVRDFAEEAYEFSMTEYAHALLMGDYLPDYRKASVIAKLSTYTGIPESYFHEHGLRLGTLDFLQHVVRERGLEAGGYDSRVTLPLSESIGERDSFDDPSMAISNPAYTSLFLSHIKKKLGIDLERSYTFTNIPANFAWEYKCRRTPSACLTAAMRRNPSLRVMFASGYYDLCTCAGYTRYIISQIGLSRERTIRREYEGGHMIYTRDQASAALAQDIREFVKGSL